MENNLLLYLIYFGAGVLQDIAVTIYYGLIAEKKALPTSVASFILTIINMFVLYGVVSTLSPENSVILILIFGLGNALGAYLAIKFYPKRKK